MNFSCASLQTHETGVCQPNLVYGDIQLVTIYGEHTLHILLAMKYILLLSWSGRSSQSESTIIMTSVFDLS